MWWLTPEHKETKVSQAGVILSLQSLPWLRPPVLEDSAPGVTEFKKPKVG